MFGFINRHIQRQAEKENPPVSIEAIRQEVHERHNQIGRTVAMRLTRSVAISQGRFITKKAEQ